jgi:hypothetical protein
MEISLLVKEAIRVINHPVSKNLHTESTLLRVGAFFVS